MTDIKEENLHCPKCKPVKFTLCKTWESGRWKIYCMTKGCDYVKWEKPTKDEISCYNEED